MGDVEETVTTVEIDEETYEEIYKVGSLDIRPRHIRAVYCRIYHCHFERVTISRTKHIRLTSSLSHA